MGVPAERTLTCFPHNDRPVDFPRTKPEELYANLEHYDVIVAFDPDWDRLSDAQLKNVHSWVKRGGGLVFIGGPINTCKLARPRNAQHDLAPLLTVCPVLLKDSRRDERDLSSDRPSRLSFPDASVRGFPFLKLDPAGISPLAGWEEFFTGQQGQKEKPAEVVRGFYSCYPVYRVKEGAVVLAAWGSNEPYLVAWKQDRGQVIWLGSGETWRLRQYRQAYHERFWQGLVRQAGPGLQPQAHRQELFFESSLPVGQPLEVVTRLLDSQGQPLPRSPLLRLRISPPAGVKLANPTIELQPMPGQDQWAGWFQGRVTLAEAGDYGLAVLAPDGKEALRGQVRVLAITHGIGSRQQNLHQVFRELHRRLFLLAQQLQKTSGEDERKQVLLLKQALQFNIDEGIESRLRRLAEVTQRIETDQQARKIDLDRLVQAIKESDTLIDREGALLALLTGASRETPGVVPKALASEQEKLHYVLQSTVDRLTEESARLEHESTDLKKGGTPQLLRAAASRLESIEKRIAEIRAECRQVHGSAGELVKKLTDSKVARERIARMERTVCKPFGSLLEQEFGNCQESLKLFRKSLEGGQVDAQAGQKARETLDQLNKGMAALLLCLRHLQEMDQIQQILLDLAAEQARQSAILKAAHARCEADLLKDLLDKP